MKGILEKKETGWFVRWSDTHSFSQGTIWMFSPVHEDEYVDETILKDGDEVDFEFINGEIFESFKYVKLLVQKFIVEQVMVTGYGSHTEFWIRDTEQDKRLCMCKWKNDAEYVCNLLNQVPVK